MFFTLLAYGFSLSRNTLSIDDTNIEYYFGDNAAMLAAGRWGMVVWSRLIGLSEYSPYIYKFFGVVFLVVASVLLSCVFYTISYKKDVFPYTFLSVVFLSYPLINEIWEYNGANAMIGGNMMIGFAVILYLICSNRKTVLKMIVSGLFLTIVASSYESGLFVYVTVVFCVIFYKYFVINNKKQRFKTIIIDGIQFIPPIIIAITLRVLIGYLIITIGGLTYKPLGAVSIGLSGSFFLQTIQLIKSYIILALLNVFYFPIMLLLICSFLFFLYCLAKSIKSRSFLVLFFGLILYLSQFILSFIQMTPMPHRTVQTFSVFVPFSLFIICHLSILNKRMLKRIIIVCLFFVSIYQSTYLSQLFYYNNLRSENEISVVKQLGTKLTNLNDDKPVIICGQYDIGDFLGEKISIGDNDSIKRVYISFLSKFIKLDDISSREFVDTNVNSIINWAIYGNRDIESLFSVCGFDLEINSDLSLADLEKMTKLAENKKMNPYDILKMDNYYLVYLGPRCDSKLFL